MFILRTSKQDMPSVAIVGLTKDHVTVYRVPVGFEGVGPAQNHIPGTEGDTCIHHITSSIRTLVG